jgi:hypothetical protein
MEYEILDKVREILKDERETIKSVEAEAKDDRSKRMLEKKRTIALFEYNQRNRIISDCNLTEEQREHLKRKRTEDFETEMCKRQEMERESDDREVEESMLEILEKKDVKERMETIVKMIRKTIPKESMGELISKITPKTVDKLFDSDSEEICESDILGDLSINLGVFVA